MHGVRRDLQYLCANANRHKSRISLGNFYRYGVSIVRTLKATYNYSRWGIVYRCCCRRQCCCCWCIHRTPHAKDNNRKFANFSLSYIHRETCAALAEQFSLDALVLTWRAVTGRPTYSPKNWIEFPNVCRTFSLASLYRALFCHSNCILIFFRCWSLIYRFYLHLKRQPCITLAFCTSSRTLLSFTFAQLHKEIIKSVHAENKKNDWKHRKLSYFSLRSIFWRHILVRLIFQRSDCNSLRKKHHIIHTFRLFVQRLRNHCLRELPRHFDSWLAVKGLTTSNYDHDWIMSLFHEMLWFRRKKWFISLSVIKNRSKDLETCLLRRKQKKLPKIEQIRNSILHFNKWEFICFHIIYAFPGHLSANIFSD